MTRDRDGIGEYRILVLDGDGAAAALVKTGLESAGFGPVDLFTDPDEAMDAFRSRKYHVVWMDLDLPGTDGVKVLGQLKRYDPMAQVIVATGHSTVDRALSCLELGADDYVLKPLKGGEFAAEIVRESIRKLERWKEAIKETVLKQSERPASPTSA